jgi:hypothetical protein
MLKKLTGYLLAGIGFIGFIFFKSYKGTAIPYLTLWLFLSIFVGLLGLALIYLAKSNKLAKQEKYTKERLDRFKQSGERILLTVDNCEIRENNYYEEIINKSSSSIQQIDALYDPNRNYSQKYIEQSAIIYYYTIGDKKLRMTSQSFPFNAKTLIGYVEKKWLVLYVNRLDKNDYAFEITG